MVTAATAYVPTLPDYVKDKAPENALVYVAEEKMGIYRCSVCRYLHEGDFANEPDGYICPICGAPKAKFQLNRPK